MGSSTRSMVIGGRRGVYHRDGMTRRGGGGLPLRRVALREGPLARRLRSSSVCVCVFVCWGL